MPRADSVCLRKLPDFRDFDPNRETLTMLKPIYGLRDAFRAWCKKLRQAFVQWMSCRQLRSEPQFYCVHKGDCVAKQDVLNHAQQHVVKHEEIGARDVEPRAYAEGNCQGLSSVHAGDVKGCARKGTAEPSLAHANKLVGQCKADCTSFLHTGIQHEHSSGVVCTRQYAYIDSIVPIGSRLFVGQSHVAECGLEIHGACRSVLGAVAWTALTRADLAVYNQVVQRRPSSCSGLQTF